MKKIIKKIIKKNFIFNKIFYKMYFLLKKIYLNIFINFYSYKLTEIDKVTENNDVLENYSSKPISKTYITENKILSEEYDLQIIIPAYNVENYIEECIESILNQKTKYKILIIIINDGSTDNTNILLNKYINISNIKIINQKNKGISEARNCGLKEIFAKYIMFLDSDDILLNGAIDNLLDFSLKNDLDIVEGGYYSYVNGKFFEGKVHKNTLGNNNLFGFPWGKVIKNKIFINLRFPLKTQYEDSIFTYLIYSQNFKFGTIKERVYGYRNNPNSITNILITDKRCIETFYITEELLTNGIDFYNINLTKRIYEKYLQQIKLNYKRTLKCPEEVKKAIFFSSKQLLINKFQPFIKDTKGINKNLVQSLLENDYGKYCFICKFAD